MKELGITVLGDGKKLQSIIIKLNAENNLDTSIFYYDMNIFYVIICIFYYDIVSWAGPGTPQQPCAPNPSDQPLSTLK